MKEQEKNLINTERESMKTTGRSSELLIKASELVNGDRQVDYGDKLINHVNISNLWSAYTNFQINPHDVAVMMCLLKIARLKQGSRTEDTYLDASAYMAIAREIGERVEDLHKKQLERKNGEDNKEHRD
tara:strand:- start:535 stop:921 length:387 start_codon:yes stop_codon:yes gene_type:complete